MSHSKTGKKRTRPMTIAVDFDGTIVENKFPAIGKEMMFAFDTLKLLRKKRHKLILWTYRYGKKLEEAVEFCRERGVEFYAVNNSNPDVEFDPNRASRKINADLFIDDRNIGGFIGWGEIMEILHPEEFGMLDEYYAPNKSIIYRIIELFK